MSFNIIPVASEYQEIHPYCVVNIESVKLDTSLIMTREWSKLYKNDDHGFDISVFVVYFFMSQGLSVHIVHRCWSFCKKGHLKDCAHFVICSLNLAPVSSSPVHQLYPVLYFIVNMVQGYICDHSEYCQV